MITQHQWNEDELAYIIQINNLAQENVALKSQLAKYKEALELLANEENYDEYGQDCRDIIYKAPHITGTGKYCWEIARQALNQEGGE